jgi:hypothetical protein
MHSGCFQAYSAAGGDELDSALQTTVQRRFSRLNQSIRAASLDHLGFRLRIWALLSAALHHCVRNELDVQDTINSVRRSSINTDQCNYTDLRANIESAVRKHTSETAELDTTEDALYT